jgi:hypothetical protein
MRQGNYEAITSGVKDLRGEQPSINPATDFRVSAELFQVIDSI